MGYETTRMTKASHWRMLFANAAAFLFMAGFLAHSVIAGGMMSHSPVPSNHAYVLSEARHGSAACDFTPLQSVAKACAASAHDHGDSSGTPRVAETSVTWRLHRRRSRLHSRWRTRNHSFSFLCRSSVDACSKVRAALRGFSSDLIASLRDLRLA